MAIIGAGFVGLTAGYGLLKKGHQVTIFEKENFVGGLAAGFKEDKWTWPLERHYHHIFHTDKFIQGLCDEIGQKYTFYDAKTYSLVNTNQGLRFLRLDSPVALLKFQELSLVDRIRMGVGLAYLKFLANWKHLEKEPTEQVLVRLFGRTGYQIIWEPLMRGKFGDFAGEVNAAWFWARIVARSQKLGYFEGGFESLAKRLASKIEERGGQIKFGQEVDETKLLANYDRVIVANARPTVKLKGLGAITMILRLKEEFLPDHIYWLNITTANWPFLAVVEHTHLIDKSYYDNEHIVYVGKYLPADHTYMSMTEQQLLKEYSPYLDKIKPGWKKSLIGIRVFKAPFAQPVVPINYSGRVPPITTDTPRLFKAGMQQVYPWDRGTNFAVELGQQVAQIVDDCNPRN